MRQGRLHQLPALSAYAVSGLQRSHGLQQGDDVRHTGICELKTAYARATFSAIVMKPTTLAQLHLQASELTPRAARFAENLLRGSPQIPFEIRHAMLVALLDQITAATQPTASEWSALEQPSRIRSAPASADAIEARLFVDSCAAFPVTRKDRTDV